MMFSIIPFLLYQGTFNKEKKCDRVTFAVTFNLKLPSISHIIGKHWRTMTRDKKLLNTFSQPPMVAFKQSANLRKLLCHAKLPPKARLRTHPARIIPGMRKCGKPCPIDIHVFFLRKLFNCKPSLQ